MEKVDNKCDICGKTFSKSSLLSRHHVVHTKQKSFKCSSCPRSFSQLSSMQRHARSKHTTAAIETEDAENAIAALKHLQSQMNTSRAQGTNNQRHRVSIEEQPTCSLVQVKDNLYPSSEESQLLTVQRLERKPNKFYFICEYCAKEFSKTYDLIRHRRTHLKQTPYKCDLCVKRFSTRARLNEHRKMHSRDHHESKVTARKERRLKDDPDLLKLTQLLPNPLRSQTYFKCIYCCQVFNRKFNCRNHMITHMRHLLDGHPKPKVTKRAAINSCTDCGRVFPKPSDLERHLRTHSKQKPFCCVKCGNRFTLKSTLDRHLQVHLSKRSTVNCQVCGKQYASKTSLRLHLRLHTGAKPFRCDTCGETFRTSGHRIEHMRAGRHKSGLKLNLMED